MEYIEYVRNLCTRMKDGMRYSYRWTRNKTSGMICLNEWEMRRCYSERQQNEMSGIYDAMGPLVRDERRVPRNRPAAQAGRRCGYWSGDARPIQ